MIPPSLLLNKIISAACCRKDSKNFFMQSSPLFRSCLFSIFLKYDIVDIEKPDGICLAMFVADKLLVLFLHPSIFSIKH